MAVEVKGFFGSLVGRTNVRGLGRDRSSSVVTV